MTDPYVPPAVRGRRPFWAKGFARVGVRMSIGYLSAILLVLSTWYGISTLYDRNFDPKPAALSSPSGVGLPAAAEREKTLSAVGKMKAEILLFWVLVPPCWFWFEYFFLYRYDKETLPNGDKKPDWDNFKYGQEVSSKVWLALVTALTILYFGKDIRG
jgi:hypothetical protein